MSDGNAGGASGNGASAGGNASAGVGQSASGGEGVASVSTSESSQTSEAAVSETGEKSDTSQEQTNVSKPENQDEGEQAKKPRKLYDQAKTWFPDDEFDDDDSYYDKVIDRMNELLDYESRSKKSNESIIQTLRSEPVIGDILRDVDSGMSFKVALAKHVDLNNIESKEGDDDFEDFTKAKQERINKLKESDDYAEMVSKNQDESRKVISQFFDDKKMDEETTKEFISFVDEIHTNMNKGIINLDMLNHFFNAKNFTTEIDQAKELAEIAGKNKEIEFKKTDDKKGDGLPVVGQGSKKPEAKPESKGPLDGMFDAIETKNKLYD